KKQRDVRPKNGVGIPRKDQPNVVRADVTRMAVANITSEHPAKIGAQKALEFSCHWKFDHSASFQFEVAITIFPMLRPIVELLRRHQLRQYACHRNDPRSHWFRSYYCI